MSGDRINIKEKLRALLLRAGASAVGFSKAEPVDEAEWDKYTKWISEGKNAGMGYVLNYPELRKDPRNLLQGAKSIVSVAFDYTPGGYRDGKKGIIASYAYYPDYHKTMRKILGSCMKINFPKGDGMNWRVCIDSTPVLERYWAVKSGVGFRGDNGMVIVPGVGSRVLLAEIIVDVEIEPDEEIERDCGHCGRCSLFCPGKALSKDGVIDCRRCISYLTIEHKGEWDDVGKTTMDSTEGRNTIFGCEKCLDVCPWNIKSKHRPIPGFEEVERIKDITADDIRELDEDAFTDMFSNTALSRCGYKGIMRNIGMKKC